MIVGVHIRRGDTHPWHPEFHGDYLPLSRYMDEARRILVSTYGDHIDPGHTHSHGDAHSKQPSSSSSSAFDLLRKRQGVAALHASRVLLASDDPLVYAAPETHPAAARAQARIVLASKQALESMTGARVARGPLDTMHGWEGGFFKDVFLALGQAEVRHTRMPPGRPVLKGRSTRSVEHERFVEALVRDHRHLQQHQQQTMMASPGKLRPHHHLVGQQRLAPGPETLALRAVIARAYLLDLAVLGQADAVVCAVSSAACRVLAVMMGWEAVTEGRWRNIDGNFGWQGVVVR
jgi:hypothetical protein